MNKKVIKILFVIFLLSIAITGCSNPSKAENGTLKKEIAELKEKNTNLEKTVSDLRNELGLKEQELKSKAERVLAFQNKSNIYPIYTANLYTYKTEVDGYIYINSSISLREKLETLARVLSEVYFSNLPIQVVRIEEADKKKIAVVNVSESKGNQVNENGIYKNKSWFNLYFQGSTGGRVTSTQLIETFLQKDYGGEWIDGVKFLYNGSDCIFEHAPTLKDVNYRKR